MSDSFDVAICIATEPRPRELRRLLASLEALEVPPSVSSIHVVVVDNGAEGTVARHPPTLEQPGFDLEVVHEPRRGIPFARNASVALALERRPHFILFVDDDEEVEPAWLAQLVAAAESHRADVVSGPVIPRFPSDAPAWAVRSGLYERDRFSTGRPLTWAATNNTLVRARVFDEVTPWFEERFAASGGSDAEFFRRIGAAGYRMVWCDEAIVRETFTSDRLKLGWLVRRTMRVGSVRGSELRRGRTPAHLVLLVARALTKIGLGLPRFAWHLRRGWPAVRHLRQIVFNVGLLGGLAGRTIEEYGKSRPRRTP